MRLGRLDANSSSLASLAACLGPSGGSVKMRPGRNRVSSSACPRPITQDQLLARPGRGRQLSIFIAAPFHCYLVPLQLLQLSCGDWPWRRWPDRIDLISCLSFLNSDIFLFLSFAPVFFLPRDLAPRTLRQRLAQVDFDRSVVAWRAVSGLRTQNGLCSRQTDLT